MLTMIPLDLNYIAVIGREEHGISYYDAIMVNKMYGCEVTVPPKPCPGRPCTDKFSDSACDQLEQYLDGENLYEGYVGKI